MGELPEGWLELNIGDVALVVGGGTPKASDETNFEEPSKGIAWLTPADLSKYKNKLISHGKRDLSEKGLDSSSAKLMPKGAVVFSSRAPIGYVAVAENDISTNQGFKSFVFTNDVDSSYAYYYLKSIRHLAESRGTGTTFKEISGAVTKKLPFKLAPLNEQTRIANKLDSLLAKVEAAQTHLEKIPTILKRFRQSVLAAATSGELTKEWREEKECTDWRLEKVGNIVEKIEAGKNIKCDERPPNDNECGIIKISAVTWGIYNETQSKTLSDEEFFIENRRIKIGDFLISRANTLELLGMPVIVHDVTKNLMLSDKVLRLVMPEYEKKWLNFFIRSPKGRSEIESRATGNQQSMRNIGQKALLDIDLPRPDKKEKKEIVRRVESLFILADTVEKKYNEVKKRTDKLTQSILAKAFKGELVPQDPNDEPAIKLLERIKRERKLKIQDKKSRKNIDKLDAKISVIERDTIVKMKVITQEILMKFKDAPHDYLKKLILDYQSEITANKLWELSGFSIDDFYEKLRQEENNGLIKETPENKNTEKRYLIAG